MKRINTILIGAALAWLSVPAWAAPNCNPVPYGSLCTQCSGWMGYSSWSTIACTLNSNLNGPGFVCSTLKCGVVKKSPLDHIKKDLMRSDDGAKVDTDGTVAVGEMEKSAAITAAPAVSEIKAIDADKKVDNDAQKKHN